MSQNRRILTCTLLLSELGIDLTGIMKRSRAVFTNRFKAGDIDSLDLGGPLLFAAALAAVHLLVSSFEVLIPSALEDMTAVIAAHEGATGMQDTRACRYAPTSSQQACTQSLFPYMSQLAMNET